jgi:hypothetical protein
MFKGKKTVLAATAAAVITGGAGAWAAIPDAGGTVSSCFSNANGALRVVDTPQYARPTCNADETPLQFNQRGLTGPTGMRGPKGEPGTSRTYWAKFAGNNRLIAASEKPYGTYAYGMYGYNYVGFAGVDVTKCAVNVTIGSAESKYRGVTGNYSTYSSQWVLAYAMDSAGNWIPNLPMDVLINCSDTTYAP